jgi:hypothetical protein
MPTFPAKAGYSILPAVVLFSLYKGYAMAESIQSEQKHNYGLLVTVPVCLLLALVFVFVTSGPARQTGQAVVQPLSPAWYTPELPREEYRKNAVMVGNCFLCHAFWVKQPPDPTVRTPLFAHAAVKLNHGSNNRCYNCHLIIDRNKFVRNDGTGIMPQIPEQVCKRCHGLIYNDWQAGTHGARRGKWLVNKKFDQQTFTCTNCHDPHNPKFRFVNFAPPPTWPAKLVRQGRMENEGGPMSEYIIGPEPREVF